MFIALAFLAIVSGFWYRSSTKPDASQVVIRLHRQGGFAQQDASLDETLSGSHPPREADAIVAYCVNGWYFEIDDTLDTSVVVGSSDRLLRAAELLAADRYDARLVASVETLAIGRESASPLDLDVALADERATFGDAVVDTYLVDAAQAPAEWARDRFVVFAVSRTTWEQSVFVVDRDRLDLDAIDRFMAKFHGFGVTGNDVVLAGTGRTVFVDAPDCAQLRQTSSS